MEEARGLAVFLCHLCTDHSSMPPVLLRGIHHPAEKSFPDVFTVTKLMKNSLFLLHLNEGWSTLPHFLD